MDQSRSPELSNILEQLSHQAKKVEDAFAELAGKTDAAASQRDAQIEAGWRTMQADIDKQVKAIKADQAARKHELDVKLAEQYAQEAKARAEWAASYAVTATEMARLAALDADAARREADELHRQ